MNQRLIRFDIRLPKDAYVGEFWDEEHRKRFLLRSDAEWPLSVDPLVWPSVFFSLIFRDASKLRFGSIEVDPSVDNGNYWLNLNEMRTHYQKHKRANENGVPIAIHLFSDASLTDDFIPYLLPGNVPAALSLGLTVPAEVPHGSEFLGYDVADASWISGLNNCGYTAQEKERLAPKWNSRLNRHGLLETLADAGEFRDLCDRRTPAHAPFWVYGISRLDTA